MAKFRLKAGELIDFISPDEMWDQTHHLASLIKALKDDDASTVIFSAPTFTTTAAGSTVGSAFQDGGAGSALIYRVPVGYDGYLTRCSVDFEASNASSTTSCDLRIVADANTPAALRSLANVVPNVFSESRSHAPLFRGGQIIRVSITGGPATTTYSVSGQVVLLKRRAVDLDALQ